MCMTAETGMGPQTSPGEDAPGGTTFPEEDTTLWWRADTASPTPLLLPPAADALLPQPGEKLSCADTEDTSATTTTATRRSVTSVLRTCGGREEECHQGTGRIEVDTYKR